MQAKAHRRPTALQCSDQVAIDLHGINARDGIEQMLGQGAQARPDLDHMIVGARRDGSDDGRQDALIDQEVLTESLAGLMLQGMLPEQRSALIESDLHKGAVASERDPFLKRLSRFASPDDAPRLRAQPIGRSGIDSALEHLDQVETKR